MSPLTRIVLRGAAAVALTAAALAAVPAAPAGAAACSSSSGVSVVVDFNELGGGVRTACVAGGGGDTASTLLPAAGFSLSYVQRQPGFVCRVAGAPADSPCVNTPPTDAYWGLWWSDGESGSWTYATTGATGLRVPDGGYVALSWNGSSARSAPGVAPAPHPSTSPTPTTKPTRPPAPSSPSQPGATKPTKQPGGTAGGPQSAGTGTPSASATVSGSAKPGQKPAKKATRKPAEPSVSPTQSPTGSSAAATPGEGPDDSQPMSGEPADPDGGLPAWVAPAVIVVLFGAVGAVAVVRRRRSSTP